MNWLITGGCGFIGRALIDYLQKSGVPSGRIRVLDNLSVGSVEDLQMVSMPRTGDAAWSEQDAGCALFVGDIRDTGAVGRAMNGANCVVHLAACTGVQPSVDNPRFDCETNVLGTFNCLDAARTAGATRFIFASSGAPLGSVSPPIHEELAPHPISPYGASKLAGEGYCSAYFHCFGWARHHSDLEMCMARYQAERAASLQSSSAQPSPDSHSKSTEMVARHAITSS